MEPTKTEAVQWASSTMKALAQEVVELSRRFEQEIQALQQQPQGSDAYVDHWAQTAVILEWLQMKIQDLLREMEKLEQTWPE